MEAGCAARGTGCTKKDLLAWSSDPVQALELDKNDPPIQIICNERKVGFQIDPTQVNAEDWIGMSFEVEIGKISTSNVESLSNIFDLNGNPIENNVKFKEIRLFTPT